MRPTYHLAALLAMCVFAVSAEAGADLVPMKEGKGKPGPSDSSAAPAGSGESPHALALRARWVTVPGWSIKPYLETGTQLDGGWSVGMEYLYRRTGFDVVVSADYSWLNAADGNFLAKNHPPATDVHYLHFDKLSVLSADVSLIGHWNVLPWMEIRAGAGLGLGVVFGDIYQITNFDCTLENVGDPSKCHPRNIEVNPNDPATIDRLVAKRCDDNFVDGGRDTPSNPCYRRTDTYPFNVRVVPVINTLLGLRFRPHKNVYVHLEAGWRLVGFYLGAGPEFRF